jgi:Sensors of blue-light using FAD
MQLIYSSRPFGFDDLALSGILSIARKNNQRDGITGALICREDLYLQLLEGETSAVTQAFDRILRDDRHTEVIKRWSGDVDDRLFPNWAMRHDPARSWMWTAAEVSGGALDRASSSEVRDVFDRLSKEPAVAKQL